MSGPIKAILAVVLVLAAVAFLVIAASGARTRGQLGYCRNNLRKLGEMGLERLRGVEASDLRMGREFWQDVRSDKCSVLRGGKEEWLVKFGGLNPFGCPLRGEQPLDLGAMSKDKERFARLMSDAATIDYHGPKAFPTDATKGEWVMGGDRPGNHPRGGFVVLADLSVREQDAVKIWAQAPDARLIGD